MFRELSLTALHVHADHLSQPKDLAFLDRRLLESMRVLGCLQTLLVCKTESGSYLIIDGARRYRCAKELGFFTLPCLLWPALVSDEFDVLRTELHAHHKPLSKEACDEEVERLRRSIVRCPLGMLSSLRRYQRPLDA